MHTHRLQHIISSASNGAKEVDNHKGTRINIWHAERELHY